jgi:hypothetical protein
MTRGSGGGGYHSRPHVEKPIKTGTGSRSARPAGVSQIGTSWGNHVTTHGGSSTDYRGERLHNDRTFDPVKFGNELALNVGPNGRGGRTNHGSSGSQGLHGPVAGSSPRRSRHSQQRVTGGQHGM